MAIGFVLMTTLPGQEAAVREALSGVSLVTDHWMLFGEYDLIARVQADEEFALMQCIVEEIRQLPASRTRRPSSGQNSEPTARGATDEPPLLLPPRSPLDGTSGPTHEALTQRRTGQRGL